MRAPLPRNVQFEMSYKARYPLQIDTPAGVARFRRSRWSQLNEGREAPEIRHRQMAGWLYAGKERIALLEIEEFDPDPQTYWEELWYWADSQSAQAADAIEAMREAFGGAFANATDWGTILLLSGVWIAPTHRARLNQRAILDDLLIKVAPDYGIAVLVAYPQGFDSEERQADQEADVPVLGSFEWRQRALMRFYERVLGFKAFDVRSARPEVMWRARPDAQEHVLERLSEESPHSFDGEHH